MDIRRTVTVTQCHLEIPVHAVPNHGDWLNPVPNYPPTVASGSMCRLRRYLLQDLFAGTESKRCSRPDKLVPQHPGCQSQTPVISIGAQCQVLPRTSRHRPGNRSSVAFIAMSDNFTYQIWLEAPRRISLDQFPRERSPRKPVAAKPSKGPPRGLPRSGHGRSRTATPRTKEGHLTASY